jgi:hypothetical protein
MNTSTERDSRFDEAEAEIERGEPWLFREPDAPNPLTIEATGWSTGHTRFGEAEFLNGVDRDGKKWSVLVGGTIMRKRLIEGRVEEWNDEAGEFVLVHTEGRVQPGEVISIKYAGDREGEKFDYPDFKIARKPPLRVESDIEADASDFAPTQTDEIPY